MVDRNDVVLARSSAPGLRMALVIGFMLRLAGL
jgi:hypothetical protein